MSDKNERKPRLKAYLYAAGDEHHCTCPAPGCNNFMRDLTGDVVQVVCTRCMEIFDVEKR